MLGLDGKGQRRLAREEYDAEQRRLKIAAMKKLSAEERKSLLKGD